MPNYFETNLYTTFSRRSSLQPSASTTESALLLQKPAQYCLCLRQSLELSPVQYLVNIVKLALAPDNLTPAAVLALDSQLSNFSTRCSNSK